MNISLNKRLPQQRCAYTIETALVNGMKEPGEHPVQFNTAAVPSGMYWLSSKQVNVFHKN